MFEGVSIISILTIVFGGGGLITGIISLYHAKSQKNTMDAETFKKFFDESEERYKGEFGRYSQELERAKKEREEARESSHKYRFETDKKIDDLNNKIDNMQKRNNAKIRAINSAYRCSLPTDVRDCPVLKTFDHEMEEIGDHKSEDNEDNNNN